MPFENGQSQGSCSIFYSLELTLGIDIFKIRESATFVLPLCHTLYNAVQWSYLALTSAPFDFWRSGDITVQMFSLQEKKLGVKTNLQFEAGRGCNCSSLKIVNIK